MKSNNRPFRGQRVFEDGRFGTVMSTADGRPLVVFDEDEQDVDTFAPRDTRFLPMEARTPAGDWVPAVDLRVRDEAARRNLPNSFEPSDEDVEAVTRELLYMRDDPPALALLAKELMREMPKRLHAILTDLGYAPMTGDEE